MDLQDQLKNLFPDHIQEDTDEQKESSNIWMQDDPIICKYEKRKGKPITILEGYTGANEDFKTLEEQRKAQEKEVRKKNQDANYPSYEDYKAERNERKEKLVFTIKDKNGVVAEIILKPSN